MYTPIIEKVLSTVVYKFCKFVYELNIEKPYQLFSCQLMNHVGSTNGCIWGEHIDKTTALLLLCTTRVYLGNCVYNNLTGLH